MRISGSKVVITGAASGIGRALAELALERGAKVIAVDRDADALESMDNVTPIVADISTRSGNDAMFDRIGGETGPIDVFVANAGLPRYGPIGPPSWDWIDRLVTTNFSSVIYQLQWMLERSRNQPNARPLRFVIVASGMALLAMPGYAVYSACKAALHRFVDAFRHEAPRHAGITVVYPISTQTRFFERAADDSSIPAPVPRPMQTPLHVARSILRAIKHDRNVAYPSTLLRIGLAVNRLVPIGRLYQAMGKRQLERWLIRTGEKKNGARAIDRPSPR